MRRLILPRCLSKIDQFAQWRQRQPESGNLKVGFSSSTKRRRARALGAMEIAFSAWERTISTPMPSRRMALSKAKFADQRGAYPDRNAAPKTTAGGRRPSPGPLLVWNSGWTA